MKTWLAVPLALALSTQALAVECAAPEGTTPQGVGSQGTAARLAFLSKLLESESQAAHRWTLGWGAGYGVLTITQLSVLGLFTREEQPDYYWGALSSLVGVAFSVLDPLEVLDGGPIFAKRASQVTEEETCKLLLDGERMLREGADKEEFSTRWFIHVGNVLFNVGFGLILGLGYGHWTSAAVNTAVGTAIGEATIFTAPTQLISGWKKYRSGEAASGLSVRLVPAAGLGLGVLVVF